MNEENTTKEASTTENTTAAKKPKKTRTVDYTRTDRDPHSFRYKRGTSFGARAGSVTLDKENDGVFVIGPTPNGVDTTKAAATISVEQLQLVSVKKRPNGKKAITFDSPIGQVVVYDARAARASLRTV